MAASKPLEVPSRVSACLLQTSSHRHAVLLFLCFISVALCGALGASTDDAIVHIRTAKSATTSTSTTTTTPDVIPCSQAAQDVLARSDYASCLNAFPFTSRPAFPFTMANASTVCNSYLCTYALIKFVNAVKADCSLIVNNDQNVSVALADLSALATKCHIVEETSAPSRTSAPTPTPSKTPAPSDTEQASDGDRSLMFVGIAAGTAVVLLCVILSCANDSNNKSTNGTDAICCTLDLCCS